MNLYINGLTLADSPIYANRSEAEGWISSNARFLNVQETEIFMVPGGYIARIVYRPAHMNVTWGSTMGWVETTV